MGVGDFDGDGTFDVAVTTRDGWLFVWRTEGKAGESLFEWNGFNHDPHNTGNYETSPTPYKTWGGEVTTPTPEPDASGGEGDSTTEQDTTTPGPDASTGGSGGGGSGGCETAGSSQRSVAFLFLTLVALTVWARRRRQRVSA